MSINEVRYLPECGSTNAYVKEHFEEFGPVGAVYTENQTAGRGRLGRSWVNAEGKALYYTVAIREPLAQPATLPLLASLAVRRQLQLRYGVDCQIKWPNDLLLNGKKVVGILCESVSYGYQQQGRGILCGIGINLAQPQSYFDAANLPNGTSLALQGANVDLAADPAWLAEGLTDFGVDPDAKTVLVYAHYDVMPAEPLAAAQTAPPDGLVFRYARPHRTRFFKMLFHMRRWCCRIPADNAPLILAGWYLFVLAGGHLAVFRQRAVVSRPGGSHRSRLN